MKGSFPCTICKTPLARSSFRQGVASSFQKEIKIRRRLAKIFNKNEKDFGSLEEYYKYEEYVEDIAYAIVNDLDRAAAEAEVQKYRAENQAFIVQRNQELEQKSRAEEKRRIAEQAALDAEKRKMLEEQRVEEEERRKERERVLARVARGELRAEEAEEKLEQNVKRRKKMREEEGAKENGKSGGGGEEEVTSVASGGGFVPQSATGTFKMPKPIGISVIAAARQEAQKSITSHVGALGEDEIVELFKKYAPAGYTRSVVMQRAIEEAMGGTK